MPFACVRRMTSSNILPHFTKIDSTTIQDHYRLLPADEVYYLFEYTSGRNYAFSQTNSLISNLKKKPSRASEPGYAYKSTAIDSCAAWLAQAINPDWLNGATLVPVPPSKTKTHPDYDDRITKICRQISAPFAVDVRELVVQSESMEAAHEAGHRPTVEDLLAIYRFDDALVTPVPRRIAIVDDVLTAGVHYRAMHTMLAAQFPHCPIVAMFIARRVFEEPPEDIVF